MTRQLSQLKHEYSGWMAFMAVIILVIYFTMFTMIAQSAENLSGETLIGDSGYKYETDSSVADKVKESRCSPPNRKYVRDSNGSLKTEKLSTSWHTSDNREEGYQLNCMYTGGVADEESCEKISGCEWTSNSGVIDNLMFWDTSYSTCIGDVNFTYYDMEPVVGNKWYLPSKQIYFNYDPDKHLEAGINEHYRTIDPTSYNKTGDKDLIDVCDHPVLDENQNLCEEVFLCNYDGSPEPDSISEGNIRKQTTSFVSTIINIFTFQYDFGFDNMPLLSAFLNFIFVGIPFLILLGCIIMLLVMGAKALPFT